MKLRLLTVAAAGVAALGAAAQQRPLTPYEEERREQDRVRARKPDLALVRHTPAPEPKARSDYFVWISLDDRIPVEIEA